MDADKNDVEIYDPPHDIANKISVGGPNAITEALLERTEKNLIVNFGNMYSDWLAEDIRKLDAYLDDMQPGMGADGAAVVDFRACVHELRGMGGTFNYALVTAIGDQMYRMIANVETISVEFQAALMVHLDALKLVAGEQLQGDGGDRGQEILAGLRKVFEKFS